MRLSLEGTTRDPKWDLTVDDKGIWSITTTPLEPDYYGYTFNADGVTLLDPSNSVIKPNLRGLSNVVHIAGANLPWEDADVPHGEVHHHFYHSAIIGDDRDYYVYTPPGYDAKAKTRYPVLYLFHGFSDDASGWTAVGRANVILDNLIAQKKAKPMLIVMTLGYGVPEVVKPGSAGLGDPVMRDRNYDRFRDALFTEVIPAVQKEYRALDSQRDRAIAGLSMGGAESLYIGLNAIDKFGYIGSFSAGGSVDSEKMFPSQRKIERAVEAALYRLRHGRSFDRTESRFLTTRGVRTPVETPGAHVWVTAPQPRRVRHEDF